MKKAHINSLTNLLTHYNKEEIVAQLDIIGFDKADRLAKAEVFATDTSALAWFKDFCAQCNLTVTAHTRTSRSGVKVLTDLHYVEEFGYSGYNKETKTYGPYFMLWLNDQGPHVELGSSYIHDLWSNGLGLQQLENKMHKICAMNVETA